MLDDSPAVCGGSGAGRAVPRRAFAGGASVLGELISGVSLSLLLLAPVLTAATAEPGSEPLPPARLEGNVVKTGKHIFTIAATGLPEQIAIEADRSELPLEKRDASAPPAAGELLSVGRGAQLRAPIRLEGKVEGKVAVAQAAEPAKLTAGGPTVSAASKLAAGRLKIALEASYGPDGSMTVKLAYDGQGATVESLDLVVEFAGPMDTLVVGSPVRDEVRSYRASEFALGQGEGVAWANAGEGAKGSARARPGVVEHLFLGNGDRGFTWLTEGAAGWAIDKAAPTMTILRDKFGQATWRISFVNHAVKLDGPRTLAFTILTHPASSKAPDRRRASWLEWPFEGAVAKRLALAPNVRSQAAAPLRADCATVHEAYNQYSVLEGPAGGDAISAKETLCETCPMPLFRYLAGTHTRLTARLVSNSAKLTRPGASPAPDRTVVGRALLHDIGLDASRLADLTLAARTAAALSKFGYFEPDGQTEFIPYWRSRPFIRYGQEFKAEDAFGTSVENPLASVYLSVYRRPGAPGRNGTRALIVVVNEGVKPVREQLYILDPGRIFGGPNSITAPALIEKWDFSRIPPDSDWRKQSLQSSIPRQSASGQVDPTALADLEDAGFVRRAALKDGIEVYGPLFVPAHSFRLLYGTSER